MFTGIIKNLGTVKSISKRDLWINAAWGLLKKLKKGSSIAVNGACLTVKAKGRNFFAADLMPETFKKTMFAKLRASDTVNLEPALKPTDDLGGHFMQGHIDGTAIIKKITAKDNSRIFFFAAKPKIMPYLTEKGSIALNGVSLTLIDVKAKSFTVGLIPHTLKSTNLGQLKVGDEVNLEIDMFAKLAFKFIRTYAPPLLVAGRARPQSGFGQFLR